MLYVAEQNCWNDLRRTERRAYPLLHGYFDPDNNGTFNRAAYEQWPAAPLNGSLIFLDSERRNYEDCLAGNVRRIRARSNCLNALQSDFPLCKVGDYNMPPASTETVIDRKKLTNVAWIAQQCGRWLLSFYAFRLGALDDDLVRMRQSIEIAHEASDLPKICFIMPTVHEAGVPSDRGMTLPGDYTAAQVGLLEEMDCDACLWGAGLHAINVIRRGAIDDAERNAIALLERAHDGLTGEALCEAILRRDMHALAIVRGAMSTEAIR